MIPTPLALHPGLASAGRLPRLLGARTSLSALEIAALLLLGVGAAVVSATVRLQLRIPGHAILLTVFPMALGLALVPRHGAGVCMGLGAFGTAWLCEIAGFGRFRPGAMTSLCATGPLLDLALLGARRGWRLYLGMIAAGLASNLIALVVRGGFKALLPEPLEGRPFSVWLAEAAITYPVCGMLAGLVSAVVWFRFRSRSTPPENAA